MFRVVPLLSEPALSTIVGSVSMFHSARTVRAASAGPASPTSVTAAIAPMTSCRMIRRTFGSLWVGRRNVPVSNEDGNRSYRASTCGNTGDLVPVTRQTPHGADHQQRWVRSGGTLPVEPLQELVRGLLDLGVVVLGRPLLAVDESGSVHP